MSHQRNEKKAKQELLRKAKLLDSLAIRAPESFRQDETSMTGFLDIAGTYCTLLQQAKTEGALREATQQIMRSLSGVLDRYPVKVIFEGSNVPMSLACKQGCNHCCQIRVTAFAPQVLAVAKFLRTNLQADALEQLVSKLERYVETGKSLTPLHQVNRSEMCPLNVAGNCIVYPVRPLGCMRHHSFSLDRCLESFDLPDGDVRIPQDAKRWSVATIYSAAIERSLSAFELNADVLEFIPALLIALRDDTAGTRYMQGENVFAEAHRPDVLEAEATEFAKREPSLTS